jgi:hypothetical protein
LDASAGAAEMSEPLLFMSCKQIVANWDAIKKDADNRLTYLNTPSDFITAAERGEIVILGFRLVIQDHLA